MVRCAMPPPLHAREAKRISQHAKQQGFRAQVS
jgi:hypothetical protein